jgi:hypothetical protein
MDLRIQKTLRNIREAFFELAKEKPVDDIMVKELCDRALINKATFYAHYDNINELIIMLEDEYIKEMTSEINFTDLFYTDPEQFLLKLWQSYQANPNSALLVKGRRGLNLVNLLIESLRRSICRVQPDTKNNQAVDIALTFCVYGISSVGPRYRHLTLEERAKQAGRAVAAVLKEFELWQHRTTGGFLGQSQFGSAPR